MNNVIHTILFYYVCMYPGPVWVDLGGKPPHPPKLGAYRMYVCVCVCMHVCVCVCMYVWMCVYVFVCMYVYVCICVYVYVCMCMYVCVLFGENLYCNK